MGEPSCVQVYGMNRAQTAAFQYHGNYPLHRLDGAACEWLVIDADALPAFERLPAKTDWEQVKKVWRPSDNNENVILYKRAPAAPAPHHE
jgi:hypothetical protein